MTNFAVFYMTQALIKFQLQYKMQMKSNYFILVFVFAYPKLFHFILINAANKLAA